MQKTYKATADLAGGKHLEERGTLKKCVDWSETIMQSNAGDVTITIRDTGGMEPDDAQ